MEKINNKFEKEYKKLIRSILTHGSLCENRTKVKTLIKFGEDMIFDMSNDEMPVITGKQVFYEKAIIEFEWMKLGSANVSYLKERGVHWWDEYADIKGDLGKIYGYQLRKYNGYFDQFEYIINELKNNSRRAHLTFWNPCDLNDMSLPSCYTGMTFVLSHDNNVLNANMQFRSSDVFLGLPYDFIVGAMFLRHFAKITNKKLGLIKYSLDNAHIYINHIKQCNIYLRSEIYDLPIFKNNRIYNYKSGPYLEAKMNN